MKRSYRPWLLIVWMLFILTAMLYRLSDIAFENVPIHNTVKARLQVITQVPPKIKVKKITISVIIFF